MNKREILIETAIKLFVENGFHGTATAKIAKEAGVANGTLFQYFKTKEDLILAIFIIIKDEMAFHESVEEVKNVKETIQNQVTSLLFWALDNKEKFHFIQQFYTSPFINLLKKSELEKYTKHHFDVLELGIIDKIIKPLPADLLYLLVSNQVFGIYQFLLSKKHSKSKQKEIINNTFEMLWDMISIN
jgi:AcrR family transcriptional regulator